MNEPPLGVDYAELEQTILNKYLYAKEQIWLWERADPETCMGPVRLVKRVATFDLYDARAVWDVIRLETGKWHQVGIEELTKQMDELEALAWMGR